MVEPKYKRILIKLSGEALAGERGVGIDIKTVQNMAQEIKEVHELGIEIALVIGGGNLWIVIFGAGIGSPYFSTDTTAALRAAEIEADAILMAKNGVDGVYNADPKKDKTAVKFEELTHRDVINKGLRIMDSTASTISMDNDIDLVVFHMNEPGNIKRVVFGENIGTTVSNNVEK